MHALLFAGLLLVVTLPTVVSQSSSAEPCVARQDATDPAGDVAGEIPFEPPNGVAAMDLLAVSMWRTEEGLGMSGTLAADPREDADAVYYYWISFEAEKAAGGGNPATWTFQRTSTYDRISTMYWDERSDFPVAWEDGRTFSFLIPWEDFEEQYGNDWPMDIGSPSLSSSGPYYLNDEPTGYGNYAAGLAGWNDWAEYDRELVPLPDCAFEASTAQGQPAGDPSTAPDSTAPARNETDAPVIDGEKTKGAPALGLPVTLLLVALVATLRRHSD